MLQRITLLSLSLVVGFSRCTRDAPTAAEPRALAAPDTVDLALARQQVAGLVVALEDARSRILPTLGSGASAQALGRALGARQHALSGAEAAVAEGAWGSVTAAATRHQVEASLLLDSEVPLGQARAAATELGAEASLRSDVDVVLLVLERITAVARGPADPVPGDAQPTAEDRREQ